MNSLEDLAYCAEKTNFTQNISPTKNQKNVRFIYGVYQNIDKDMRSLEVVIDDGASLGCDGNKRVVQTAED